MPMKVEAAVVTQKREAAQFNSDSVNINGKILPRDVILNGYKGAGLMSEPVCFALASSKVDGFADAAVAAFNERISEFGAEGEAPSDDIEAFFKDIVYAINQTGRDSSELDTSVIYGKGRTLFMAKTGRSLLYSYSADVLTNAKPLVNDNEDEKSGWGICEFPSVAVGDIFILVSTGVSEVLTDADIEDICAVADGSVKKIVNLISKIASVKENDMAVSVIAVKILEVDVVDDNDLLAFSEGTDSYGDVAAAAEEPYSPEFAPEYGTDEPDKTIVPPVVAPPAETKNKRLIIAIAAVLAALIILGAVITVIAVLKNKNSGEDETTTEITTATEESTTAPESTTARQEVTTQEQTTAVTTTAPAETTTRKPVVLPTAAPVTTTKAPVTTTAPSTTAQPTTAAETTTYVTIESSSAATEESTAAQETKPAAVEEESATFAEAEAN